MAPQGLTLDLGHVAIVRRAKEMRRRVHHWEVGPRVAARELGFADQRRIRGEPDAGRGGSGRGGGGGGGHGGELEHGEALECSRRLGFSSARPEGARGLEKGGKMRPYGEKVRITGNFFSILAIVFLKF